MRTRKLPFLSVLVAEIFLTHVSAQEYPLTNRDLRATTVSPASGVATMVFTADPALSGEDIFEVVSSGPGVVVTLLVPSGVEIGSSNASSMGFGYDTLAVTTAADTTIPALLGVPGFHTLIRLPENAPPGSYTIKFDPSAANGSALVIGSYFSSSSVRAGLFTGKPPYRVGENIGFSGIVYDGAAPVTGATATLSIGDPTDASSESQRGPAASPLRCG